MRSTFHLLEVSKRGLFAQQSALNTTGHNISNANTEGYTRQRANMQATKGIPAPGMNVDRAPGQMGTGVEVTDLQRIREDYLDVQFRTENKHFGYWEARRDGLEKIETIFNEPSDTGLQKVMDDMWKSWQDLVKEPESLSARAVVRQRAVAIAETFGALTTSMKELQTDLDNVVRVKAIDINSIATQIANINKQIADVVPHGYQPNDLYDQRDVLIDKLSKMTEVKVTTAESGMVNVTIEGQNLVTGRTSVPMTVGTNETTGLVEISLGGAVFTPKTGSLAGTFESRGYSVDGQMVGVIPDMLRKLDALALNMTTEINNLHRQGVNLFQINNTPGPANIPFFVQKGTANGNPTGAASFEVNPEIMKSLNAIAAGTRGTGGTTNEGDGSNAQAIASLKFKTIIASTGSNGLGETTTLDDFYRYTIAQLGVDSQESMRMEKNSDILVGQVDTQRMSVSGVSIDEEMAEMVKYQHAYNASARVMTSMDEILDKIINGMGRVGL
ncbi:flagellar hook-associated protein FlgK [Brevibacillus dissolubilis]|uniref:flagellar hook-associated protein FlgK n=1 Tax=Brevibacillus dissolubilis TaxID=1844116 RepID=UPI00111764ED|nr:flagellar hook-associated protein FlgK [Brevibacillus dissolubilis]